MIFTKSHKIKELENQIEELKKEIKIDNSIIEKQSQIIEALERRIIVQCRKIKKLNKRK